MNMISRPFRWPLAATIALFAMCLAALPVLAQDFGEPEDGQHVYDVANLLTAEEITNLEERAATVGAPVVIYLQPKDADFDETLDDARALMEEWDVQSKSGARDGVVIFLNLDPDDLRHGQLAVVAGERHFDGGNLPQYELDRIADDMRDVLAEERTAEGIELGLEMIASSLAQGPAPPPEPSRAEQIASDLAAGPLSLLNVVSAIAALIVSYVTFRSWRARPVSDVPATLVTEPPGDLMPAIAGALVTRNVSDGQMEATLLDFARRGALAVEPADAKKNVRVRLLDGGVVKNNLEEKIWRALELEANADGVIENKRLSKVRAHWSEAKQTLRRGLEERGLFDPDSSRPRRRLFLAALVTFLLAILGLVISIVGDGPLGLVGVGLLITSSVGALAAGSSYPHTTPQGEAEAQPWRGYLQGLKDAAKDDSAELDLDVAVPYLVAMNAGAVLNDRLEEASETGYTPAWLGATHREEAWGVNGFFPYWIAFHGSISPNVGAGAGAGGAAAGSGGAGGSF